MKAYDCYSVLEKLSAALVVFRADSAHEMTVCTIASIHTFIEKYVTVTCNLGHKQLLHFKSKIEVLRETTGPSHWDAHVLVTGGTLVGNHFSLSQNVYITDRRSAVIHE